MSGEGVFQDEATGQFSWRDGEVQGGQFETRDAARADLKIKRAEARAAAVAPPSESSEGAGTPQAEPATPKQPKARKLKLVKPNKKAEEQVSTATKTKRGAAKRAAKGRARSKRTVGAVAKMREIFAKMGKASRKEVLDAVEKAGLNRTTAAYQYWRWQHRKDS